MAYEWLGAPGFVVALLALWEKVFPFARRRRAAAGCGAGTTEAFDLLLEIAGRGPRYRVGTLDRLQVVQAAEMEARAYGEHALPGGLLLRWWEGYDQGLHGLFDNNAIVGALGLWPVTESWIRSFSEGIVGEASLTTEIIRAASGAPSGHWYVGGLVVEESARSPAAVATLVLHSVLNWMHVAQVSYPVTVWAIGVSRSGELLLKRFGFELLARKSRMIDGCDLYRATLRKEDVLEVLKLAASAAA